MSAIDVISDPMTGNPVCRDAAARSAGCVPLSILGRDQATPEALAYINVTALRSLENEQQVLSAVLSGDAFSLPAGRLQFATGLEYRKETYSFADDPLAQSGDLFYLTTGSPNLDAGFDVFDGFVEVRAPIVVDKPMFEELNIDAAVRYSDYNTIGGTVAWKFGLDWAVDDDLRLRATRASSVRAPNLIEQFGPGVGGLLIFPDPCDASVINSGSSTRAANCTALGAPVGYVDSTLSTYPVITSGNTGLSEETSKSWTAGAVLSPSAVEGFSLSLDYWRIDIANAISTVDPAQILNRCVDLATTDNPFCGLVSRDPTSFEVTQINVTNINIGSLKASGVDIQARYDVDLGAGDLRFNLTSTYLIDNEELVDATDETSLNINAGEIANPTWRGNLMTSYMQGPLSLSLNTRFVGSAKVDVQISDEALDRNEIKSHVYLDLAAAYNVNDHLRLVGGVNNLTNAKPPAVVGSDLLNPVFIGANGHYENLGRYLHLAARYQF